MGGFGGRLTSHESDDLWLLLFNPFKNLPSSIDDLCENGRLWHLSVCVFFAYSDPFKRGGMIWKAYPKLQFYLQHF